MITGEGPPPSGISAEEREIGLLNRLFRRHPLPITTVEPSWGVPANGGIIIDEEDGIPDPSYMAESPLADSENDTDMKVGDTIQFGRKNCTVVRITMSRFNVPPYATFTHVSVRPNLV